MSRCTIELEDLLSRTPQVLRALLENLPDHLVRGDEGPGTFSPFDVVGHLIHGERADWIPRARFILEKGESGTFERFDRFAQQEASRGKTLGDLLDDFVELRMRSVAALAEMELTEADLEKTGRHPEFGTVTLGGLIHTWAVHDLDHLAQVARVMAAQYADRTGPWRVYLRIIGGGD